MFEYKVLIRNDDSWSGHFSAERLEEELNLLAMQGWRVITACTDRIGNPNNPTDEMTIILERETWKD